MDTRANKRQITEAVRRMYEIKTAKVNTLVRCAAAAVASIDVGWRGGWGWGWGQGGGVRGEDNM